MNSLTRTAVFPVTLAIAVVGGLWIQWLVFQQKLRNWHRARMAQDPNLPAGVSEYGDGINGAEPRGDDGLTESERREIEKSEHRADLERESW